MNHMLNILIITVLALVVIAAGVQLCRPKGRVESKEPHYEVDLSSNHIDYFLHGMPHPGKDNDIDLGRNSLTDYAKIIGLKAHCLNNQVDCGDLSKAREEIMNDVYSDILAYFGVTDVNVLSKNQIDWYVQKVIKELKESDMETLNHKPKL